MVHLRLSRRLAGRVDDSDILQEAYLDAARRLAEYVREPISAVLPLAAEPHRLEAG